MLIVCCFVLFDVADAASQMNELDDSAKSSEKTVTVAVPINVTEDDLMAEDALMLQMNKFSSHFKIDEEAVKLRVNKLIEERVDELKKAGKSSFTDAEIESFVDAACAESIKQLKVSLSGPKVITDKKPAEDILQAMKQMNPRLQMRSSFQEIEHDGRKFLGWTEMKKVRCIPLQPKKVSSKLTYLATVTLGDEFMEGMLGQLSYKVEAAAKMEISLKLRYCAPGHPSPVGAKKAQASAIPYFACSATVVRDGGDVVKFGFNQYPSVIPFDVSFKRVRGTFVAGDDSFNAPPND